MKFFARRSIKAVRASTGWSQRTRSVTASSCVYPRLQVRWPAAERFDALYGLRGKRPDRAHEALNSSSRGRAPICFLAAVRPCDRHSSTRPPAPIASRRFLRVRQAVCTYLHSWRQLVVVLWDCSTVAVRGRLPAKPPLPACRSARPARAPVRAFNVPSAAPGDQVNPSHVPIFLTTLKLASLPARATTSVLASLGVTASSPTNNTNTNTNTKALAGAYLGPFSCALGPAITQWMRTSTSQAPPAPRT